MCMCCRHCMLVLTCCSSPVVHPSVIEALTSQLQNANASLVPDLVCRTQERVSVFAEWRSTVAAHMHIHNVKITYIYTLKLIFTDIHRNICI